MAPKPTSKPRESKPPQVALWLLRFVCDDVFLEEFEGDLAEVFEKRLSRSRIQAHLWYWLHVISMMKKQFASKPSPNRHLSGAALLYRNYLNVSWRSFVRNQSFSFINVTGLSVGIACCLFIALFIKSEFNYDRFHQDGDRIYRITSEESNTGRLEQRATTYLALAPVLVNDFTEIEVQTRFYPFPTLLVDDGGTQIQADGLAMVDSTFLEVFSFPLEAGDPTTALDAPFSIVLTSATAKRIFGSKNPMGEALKMRTDRGLFDFKVTGIARDVVQESHLQFSALASISSLETMANHVFSWYWPPAYTYVKLAPGTDSKEVESRFKLVQDRYLTPQGVNRTYGLQPLNSIHLSSNLVNEVSINGSLRFVVLLSIIALMIIGIACINFMNLATAQSIRRSQEVGIRKVLGAKRSQLIHQFLSESFVTSAIAMVIAAVLVVLLFPLFETLVDRSFALKDLLSFQNAMIVLGVVALIGLVTGSYPALFLSQFSPKRILSGLGAGRKSFSHVFRKGLVVLQFVITSSLIVGTLVIQQQLSFLQTDRLGFNKEHVLVVPLRDTKNQIDHTSLKNEWMRDSRITSVSSSSGYPSLMEGLHDFMVIPSDTPEDSSETLILTVDHDFVKTYQLELLAGRDFSETRETDAVSGFIINEAAAKKFGWTSPVGKKLTLKYWTSRENKKQGEVVGVVKDFQYLSLHRAVDPIVFHIQPNSYYNDFLSVRLATDDLSGLLATMEGQWKLFNPDRPFEYFFVDEKFNAMYQTDMKLQSMLTLLSVLAVVIACLGLFGLAAFTTEQRRKEIGVRKVLGANVSEIVVLLSKDFLKLIVFAFVVATPMSYFVMINWLEEYSEHIPLGPGIFLLSGGLALGIGMAAVAYQSVRAAHSNPAISLKSE